MTDVGIYAKRDCSFCFGKGEVKVERGAAWTTTAVCSCVSPGWKRVLTADALLRSYAMRRAGLAR